MRYKSNTKILYFYLFLLLFLFCVSPVFAATVTDGFDDETQIASKNQLTVTSSHVQLGFLSPPILNQTGLVLWYHMNNTGGYDSTTNVYDWSIEGNNGTKKNVGEPTWTTSGWFEGGLSFDGDDYVNCGNDPSLRIDNSITLEAWIYNENIYTIPAIFGHYFMNRYCMLLHKSGGIYYLETYFSDGGGSRRGSTAIPVNGWSHLVITADTTENKIYFYVNGTQEDMGAVSPWGVDTWNIQLGDIAGGNSIWKGRQDEVRIYNRAINTTEVVYSYNTGLSKYDDGIMYSTNLLFGLNVTEIESFGYDANIIGSENVDFQFSQDNTTWYNSTSLEGWETGLDGINTVNLGVLSWDGGFFYYRANFTAGSTPELESITLTYNTSTVQSYFLASLLLIVFIVAPVTVLIRKRR